MIHIHSLNYKTTVHSKFKNIQKHISVILYSEYLQRLNCYFKEFRQLIVLKHLDVCFAIYHCVNVFKSIHGSMFDKI